MLYRAMCYHKGYRLYLILMRNVVGKKFAWERDDVMLLKEEQLSCTSDKSASSADGSGHIVSRAELCVQGKAWVVFSYAKHRAHPKIRIYDRIARFFTALLP